MVRRPKKKLSIELQPMDILMVNAEMRCSDQTEQPMDAHPKLQFFPPTNRYLTSALCKYLIILNSSEPNWCTYIFKLQSKL